MTKTKQMRIALWCVMAVFIVAVVLLILLLSVVKGADAVPGKSTGNLSDTDMWVMGIICSAIGTCVIAVALILRKHENDIVTLLSRPDPVSNTVCIANIALINSELSHGIERFVRIDKAIAGIVEREDNSKARHDETLALLRELKN